MALKIVKKKDHENLSDSNIQKVADLLKGEKPVTKKLACEMLNISYNTARLNNIIESFISRKAIEKKHRDANRGKPATKDEIRDVIQGHLKGDSASDIAKDLYRSSAFVRGIIDRVGVPQKVMGDAKSKPAILPDACIAETFRPGQIAWSAIYHSPCEIIREVKSSNETNYEGKYGSKCYKIYVIEPLDETPEFYPSITVGGFYAYSVANDLGSLQHLLDYGVDLNV